MTKLEKIGVILGRFAPLHKGHQQIINKLIEDFGVKYSLIIIGSSTSYNNRTPYTLEERKIMISTIYPNLEIAEFADINNYSEHFFDSTLELWLEKLKTMQNIYHAQFVFYGGSSKDIDYLEKEFKTNVVVNRNITPVKISATTIRKLLENYKYKELEKYLDKRIIPLAITGYRNFRNQRME